jgi:flagellar protein FlaG
MNITPTSMMTTPAPAASEVQAAARPDKGAGASQASTVNAGNSNQNTDSARNISEKDVKEAAEKIQDFVSMSNNQIQFSVDSDSGTPVVKIVDASSDKVIRQIPSEEVLAIAKALDKLQGLLLKTQV